MTADQAVVFVVLAGMLFLFVQGRWRYDLVALVALLAVVATGVLPVDRAFEGFAHPAVLTVAGVLILSHGLRQAGVVDLAIRLLRPLRGRPAAQIVVQTTLVAVLSAFMNNVGALALMLPVALRQAYRDGYAPSIALMPLAFGSLLGGLTTLIGTPPNIIVSSYRARETGEGFAMFAYAPVGGLVALVGVAFVTVIGWRLLPSEGRTAPDPDRLFDVGEYVTELRVPPESRVDGTRVDELEASVDGDLVVLAIVRDDARQLAPRGRAAVRGGDLLLVEAERDALKQLTADTDLQLEEAHEPSRDDLRDDEVIVQEVIVPPRARPVGRHAHDLDLRTRFGVNLLAIARQGRRVQKRLSRERWRGGDVLLLQGPSERIRTVLSELGLLPLLGRDVVSAGPRRLLLAGAIFAASILAVLTGVAPAHVAFLAGAVAMVVARVLRRDEPYQALDAPVLVLLAALIPVGTALETTGATALVADGVLRLAGGLGPVAVLAVLMVATMLLTDLINNNATAVLMAPIAIQLADRMQVSLDPLLMAVAIGASCAFLTPIGHQSNTLVLEPGGYRFTDYARMGAPLDLLIVITAVPLIVWFWPF